MKRVVIHGRLAPDLLWSRPGPANDNDLPEPPPVVSQRVPRLPARLIAIAGPGVNRPVGTVARAA